jgi:hypothetical protein
VSAGPERRAALPPSIGKGASIGKESLAALGADTGLLQAEGRNSVAHRAVTRHPVGIHRASLSKHKQQ